MARGDRAWADVKVNKDFIFIQTHSGWWTGGLPDPLGKQFYLEHTVSDEELGQALADALAASRMIDPAAARAAGDNFYHGRERVEPDGHKWIAQTMEKYAYKTKRAMFKDMKSCYVRLNNDMISLQPSHHVKLEAWDGAGLTAEDNVVIPETSSPVEIGAALRLALSRCLP